MRVPLHDVSASVPKGDGIFAFPPSFRPGHEVLLGFSPTNYHAFVVAGEIEMHPRLYWNRSFIRPARPASVRAGFFVRFPEIENERRLALAAMLRRMDGGRCLNCLDGVSRAFREGAGFSIPGCTADASAREILEAVFERGVVDESNRAVAIELYVTRPRTPAALLDDASAAENAFRWAFVASRWLARAAAALHVAGARQLLADGRIAR